MSRPDDIRLTTKSLRVTVADRTLVDDLDFELAAGEVVALLGRNGAGKTLLLHTLAGLRDPAAGDLGLAEQAIDALGRQELARCLVLMPQHADDVFPATVLETALIGRHPHIDRFAWETAGDVQKARDALAAVDLAELESRDVSTLSGGERRRLAIAQCLTQEAPLMLLDEPTNHLDPQHQLDALELFRHLANQGRGLLMALHDVNFAARYADRCLLLYGDGSWETGQARDVLTPDRLEALYGTPMQALPWQDRQVFVPIVRERSR